MPTTTTPQRFLPDLKEVVPYKAEVDHYQLRTLIYGLLDLRPQVLDYTLSASLRVNAKLTVGQPLIVIARQDVTGGWNVEWATNSDGSLRFKGTSLVTVTTTANTYSAYLFMATSEREAMLISYVTGGNLS